MSFVVQPGDSSLADCPPLLRSSGYQVEAGTDSVLCLAGHAYDENASYRAKVASIYCPREILDAEILEGDENCGLLLKLPDAVLDKPGIYSFQFAKLNEQQRPMQTHTGIVAVDPSMWAAGDIDNGTKGPISVKDIRTRLRDIPGGTTVEGYEFSTDEIIQCILKPIQFWNETPPPGFAMVTPLTFPYTYQWIEATCACLLRISSAWFLRQSRRIQYSGGVTTDDREKTGEYLQLAERMWNSYVGFVRETRMSLVRNSGVRATTSALPPDGIGGQSYGHT